MTYFEHVVHGEHSARLTTQDRHRLRVNQLSKEARQAQAQAVIHVVDVLATDHRVHREEHTFDRLSNPIWRTLLTPTGFPSMVPPHLGSGRKKKLTSACSTRSTESNAAV
jgi:hypothetical protein